MKRIFLLVLGIAVASVPGVADIHPNLQRGIVPGKSVQVGDVDHVNMFNGNLTLTIPIGGVYPVGGQLAYGLTLAWGGQPWRYIDDPSGDQALPKQPANAGFGWMLSLGRLETPYTPANEVGGWAYVSPDGAAHKFYSTLHLGEGVASTVRYTRDGSYLRLKELAGGVTEVEFPDGQIHRFGTTDGELKQMRDQFGNSVTVTALAGGSWYVSDSTGRSQSIQVNVTADAVLGKRVTSAVVKTVGGGTATYSFGYTPTTVDRPCTDTSPYTGLLTLELLTSVTLPDGSSYQFPEYHTDQTGGCLTPGAIKSMLLPTLGKIGWTYQRYGYPTPEEKAFRTSSNGVLTRTTYTAGGVASGAWTYTTTLLNPPTPQSLLNTATTPLGHRSEHFFSVSRVDATTGWNKYEYGLPLTHDVADPTGTRFLSSRVYNSAGALLRSTYVRYEWDNGGSLTLPEVTNLNQRLASTRTVYDDDGGRYADATFSDFDGLGHFRSSTTGGNFDAGNVRATYTRFNPANGTYPGSFAMVPTTAPWILGTFDQLDETEGSKTARRTFAVDASTGWVNRTRIHRLDTGGVSSTDVIVETTQSFGNLSSEKYYGGDLQALGTGALATLTLPAAQFQVDHTTHSGTRATSRYIGTPVSFYTLDQTIDPSTGAVTASRDTTGLTTSYEYEVLGRVSWVKPALGTGQDGWTEYAYARATSASALAKVNVYNRPNGGGTPLAESAVLFDAFGRVSQEQRKMPNGTWSSRQTTYNAAGLRSAVSEQGNTARKTEFLSYDPFGRPATIRPPDGAAHDVNLAYWGVRQVERKVKVATSTTGYGTSWNYQIYDRQGRLHQVKEDANPDGSPTRTTYSYDVGNNLVQVNQLTGSGTQNRYFTYDRRGFLISESHPEKGDLGNGTVKYFSYDALGNAGRKEDGPSDLRFTYDRAGRVTRIDEPAPAPLTGLRAVKAFTYGTSNLATNRSNGKLAQATRYNYVGAPFDADVQVIDTYTFGGRQGRVSRKTTQMVFKGVAGEAFAQSYAYDPLGNVSSVTYPDCIATQCGTSSPRSINFTYGNGWLTAVPGFASSITYHSNGLYNQVTHANGAIDTQTNDPNHMTRPAELFTQRSGVDVWRSGGYQYDGVGNVKKIGGSYFVYDPVSRLTKGYVYDGPTGAGNLRYQLYTYDAFGNLTKIEADHGDYARLTPTAPATNRLTGGSYDAAGNMYAWNGNAYEYDGAGMMSRNLSGSEDWRYVYTADDERFWAYRVGGAGSVWTLRGLDGKVLREYDAHVSWSTFRDYVYRDGQLLASVYPGEGQRQFHLDHLGTPRAVTNSAGTRVAYHVYFPFGEQIGNSQDVEQMKFTGHERDRLNASGVDDDLDYMHARYYNPMVGRFLSVDPVNSRQPRRPQTWNRYAYARGNLMRLIDPDGKTERDSMSIYLVRVNVLYSDADRRTLSGDTLRNVTERGIASARNFFAKAGIALAITRIESQLAAEGRNVYGGRVETPGGPVDLNEFLASSKNVNVMVSGNANISGGTVGVGGPTLIGVTSNEATLTDELAHALGNVWGMNLTADLVTDWNELMLSLGGNLEPLFEEMLRSTAAQVGCQVGMSGCNFQPSPK